MWSECTHSSTFSGTKGSLTSLKSTFWLFSKTAVLAVSSHWEHTLISVTFQRWQRPGCDLGQFSQPIWTQPVDLMDVYGLSQSWATSGLPSSWMSFPSPIPSEGDQPSEHLVKTETRKALRHSASSVSAIAKSIQQFPLFCLSLAIQVQKFLLTLVPLANLNSEPWLSWHGLLLPPLYTAFCAYSTGCQWSSIKQWYLPSSSNWKKKVRLHLYFAHVLSVLYI